MNPRFRMPGWLCAIRGVSTIAALVATAGLSTSLHASPLSFDAAVELATRNAPQWSAAQSRVDASRQAAVPSGELPDPKLAVGIENYPVGGPDRYSLSRDFMTMQRIAVMQEVPNREKREARVALAQARVRRSEAEQRSVALMLKREAAAAWIRRFTIERQLGQLDDLVYENRRFEVAIRAQLAAGRSPPADAVMPRQEAAMLAERRDELVAQRTQAIAALRRWIGEAAIEPLEGVPGSWPLPTGASADDLHHHPEVLAMDAAGSVLDAEVREAQAMKKADWGVEVAYQRRAPQFGDMISLQFTFDLPLFQARRQDPLVAAKLSERTALEAEREALRQEHTQAIASDRADYERVERALERNRVTNQRLAEEKIALTMASYRGGKGLLSEVMAARRERLEQRMKEIVLEGEKATLGARLHFVGDAWQQTGADR